MKKNILSILSVVLIMLVVSTGCKKKGEEGLSCSDKLEAALELSTQYNIDELKATCEEFKSEANSLLASCADELTQAQIDNIQDIIDNLPDDCVKPDVKE